MTKKKRANVPDQPITTLAYSPMVNRDLAKREAVEQTHAVLTVYSEFRDQQEDKIDTIMQHLNDMNAACVGLVTATLADNIARGQGTLRGIFKVMPLDRQLADSLASWKAAIDDYMLWLDSWERQCRYY
jgi:hypothetical protein